MYYFHYINAQGVTVVSNISKENGINLDLTNEFENRIYDEENKVYRRQKLEISESGKFYFAVEDNQVTNTELKKYHRIFKLIVEFLDPKKLTADSLAGQRVRRLKHNVETYNANILQEIYRLIPQENLSKGAENQRAIIRRVISRNQNDAAAAVLRVLKNSTLMKSEFAVHDLLTSSNPPLQKRNHSLHKVVTLSLNSFWLELVEKNVQIFIQPFYESYSLDYTSLSVAFCHLFDNATKYTCPNSKLEILFESTMNEFVIRLRMLSLQITDKDFENMFAETYSGEIAEKIGLAGNGIGMFVIKSLVELNNGSIAVFRNINKNSARNEKGIQFEMNEFVLRFNK